MSCTPKPNGFADHYPYEKWLAIIGNIYTQHFQVQTHTNYASNESLDPKKFATVRGW